MANRYWLGINGNFTDTANWSTSRSGAGGSAAPTSSDDVFIYDGDIDITSNIGNIAAQSIRIGGNFAGSIGGSGTALTLGNDAPVYIENVAPGKTIAIGAYNSITVANIHVRSTGGGSVTIVCGTSGLVTNLFVGETGLVNVDASGAVTNLYCAGARMLIGYNATALTICEIHGGGSLAAPHIIRRACTTTRISNRATVKMMDAVATTTFHNYGGTLVYDSSGTVTTYYGYPGSALRTLATPFIVTNTTAYAGSSIPTEGGLLTYTNTPTRIGTIAA